MRCAVLILVLLLLPAVALAHNTPPVADAGEDQTIFVGEATLLQGSAFDADGNPILTWSWTVESAPAVSSPFIPRAQIRKEYA